MKKFIHIFHDEKFAHSAQYIFEKIYPNHNQFIIFTDAKKLTYSKVIDPIIYPRHLLFSPEKIEKVIDADLVIFHSMHRDFLWILKLLPPNIKTIWIGWGYDYYDILPDSLVMPKTSQILKQRDSKNTTAEQKIAKIKLLQSKLAKVNLLNKITVFAPVIHEDYKKVKEAFPNFTPKYASWNYSSNIDLISRFSGKTIIGNNVLFGNSAIETNNHLDAFEYLKKLDLSKRKVIAPLSYGNIKYRKLIIEKGAQAFGDAFHPIIDFLPKDTYTKMIRSCSVVVMNHLRQQAAGTIGTALYFGSKVFLDEKNPLYSFYKRRTLHVYSLKELADKNTDRMTPEQIKHNQAILQQFWSKEHAYRRTREMIKLAFN